MKISKNLFFHLITFCLLTLVIDNGQTFECYFGHSSDYSRNLINIHHPKINYPAISRSEGPIQAVRLIKSPPKVEVKNKPLMERVHLDSISSIYLYAKEHQETNPIKEGEWRVYTTNDQKHEEIPLEIKDEGSIWISSPENLYITYCTRPKAKELSKIFSLTQLGAIAVAKTLQAMNLKVTIKWPNDVLINDHKVSGIGGYAYDDDRNNLYPQVVFINIALNTNMTSEVCQKIDQPATSLMLQTGKKQNNEDILNKISNHLYEDFTKDEPFEKDLLPYLEAHSAYLGEKVILIDEGKETIGIHKGLTSIGCIRLDINNKEEIFFNGRLKKKAEYLVEASAEASGEDPETGDESDEEEDKEEEKESGKDGIKSNKDGWNIRDGQEWKEKVIGHPQKTGTKGHAFRSAREAIKEAKKPDTEKVYLNKGINRASDNPIKPNCRPDVTVVKKDGKVNQIEVPSKTDKIRNLQNRMDQTRNKLPEEKQGKIETKAITKAQQ